MKNNCQGPCLSHCFKEEKFIYLVIGFILGVVIYEIINRILDKIADIEIKKKAPSNTNTSNLN